MPLPAFDEHGCLPVGVHEVSTQELRDRFGRFQTSDRRPQLYAKLESLISEARKASFAVALLVDGSFVTAIAEPNDIDLVLVLAQGFDVTSDLLPEQYNLVSRKRCRSDLDLI